MKFHLRKPIPWFQIMKITFSQILIAMIVSSMTYASSLRAQDILNKKVNLTVQNSSLAEALSALQRNNNVKFIYSKNSINVSKKVTLNAAEAPLKVVLEQLLTPNGIDYEVLKDRIVLGKAAHAADGSTTDMVDADGNAISMSSNVAAGTPVTGRVVDAKGEPIIGATVVEKGTTNGVSTGLDGAYKLNVKGSKAILIFNFIGYKKQELEWNGQATLNVTLVEEANDLSEVVVIGYGTQKKSVTTGAISGVSSRDIQDQPVTRIEQTLQGRASGLTITTNDGQPGDGATVRVRGITSFNNSDPLWVVDGVVVDNGGIGFLNQSDIESVEVLKDAASAAIYGTRAAAGVILITTKKGKAGRVSVNYNGYLGTSAPARKLTLLNSVEYATLRNESLVAAGLPAKYANPATLGTGTDWQSLIFNNSAKTQDHEISISGGSEKSTFYTSLGYLDQQGIVATPISQYKRINARVNQTYKPSKWVTVGENIGYSYERNLQIGNTNSNFGGPLSSAINLDPLTPAIETNPTLAAAAPYTNANVVRNSLGYPYGISSNVGQEITNPLAYIQTRLGNYRWAHNVVGNAFVEVAPIKGLVLRSTVGTKLSFYGLESFSPLAYLNSSTITSRNNYQRENNRAFNWNIENTASYTRSFEKHNLNVLIGQGAYVDNTEYKVGVTAYGLPVNNFYDASLNYNVAAVDRIGYGSEAQPHHLASLFARLNYDYDERYIVQGIIRRDGSSRFGSNNAYGTFPSVSLGWVPTKESFWPKNEVVNFLKIRGGYGVTGNDNIRDNGFLSTISGGRNYSFGTGDLVSIGYSPDSLPNADLRWEQTSQTDIGFNAILFNDLTVDFDWYSKKTTGILETPQIPFFVGAIQNPTVNAADMTNKGVELSLEYHKKIGQVDMTLGARGSHLSNMVTKLAPGQDHLDGTRVQNVSDFVNRTMTGYSYNGFYGWQNLGIFQTQAEVDSYVNPKTGAKIQPNARPGDFKWADLNGDGTIDARDRQYLANSLPTWQYGFNINLRYKHFDFSVFAQGQGGNKIFNALHRLDIANANYTTAALGRWTGPGTSTFFPRLTDKDINNNMEYTSSFYLESGNYLRIKTMQLGYNFDANLLKKVGLSTARLYVTGQNLITFTKYKGYDPDINGSVDQGFYPQARIYMVGLNVGF